ncbi:hypothetical protein R1sor_003081 [Riccia sorocarpa]|uniref:Uncharacterized protein n=1 Tax=Riccia sorocarpa TaxID=122646 RepID=A0ABD3H4G8_9MARC
MMRRMRLHRAKMKVPKKKRKMMGKMRKKQKKKKKEPLPPPKITGNGKVVQPRGKGRPREVGIVIGSTQRLDSQAEAEHVFTFRTRRKATKGKGKNTYGPGGTSGGLAKKKPRRK